MKPFPSNQFESETKRTIQQEEINLYMTMIIEMIRDNKGIFQTTKIERTWVKTMQMDIFMK